MADCELLVSDSAPRCTNRGAYSSPFSGAGDEFFPLGVLPDHSGPVLHEVGFQRENGCWNFPKVLSPFWRLYYNAAAGHAVIFADRSVELTPQHLVLIPDHQLFHCRGRVPVPHLWLHFNPSGRLAPSQEIPLVLRPGPTELALLGDLRQLSEQKGPLRDREQIFHAGLALLHLVLSRPDLEWQGKAPPAVLQVIRHVERYYASALYIPQLARMVGLCVEALARSFKKYQGEPLGRFITKVRVREAANLLINTDDAIDDIAENTGFPNRAYLSRVFKKITGQSPAEFRQRHALHAG